MMNFSLDDANRLDWSSKPIDFVIAIRLLLMTYDFRPEAEGFRRRKNEMQTKCLAEIEDLADLIREIRAALPVGPYGTSREETQKTLSDFIATIFATVDHLLLEKYGKRLSDIDISEINSIEDPALRDATQKFFDWVQKYEEEYNKYGGTWMPDSNIINKALKHPEKSSAKFALFSDSRVQRLVAYRNDLTRLCYEYGLRCWWAPDIYYGDDLTRWSKPVPVEELACPTLDGILGPLFRRKMSMNMTAEPENEKKLELSYPEYLLASMSRKEISHDLGIIPSQVIHDQMEDWNYHRGIKWEQRDFDMLFDRLYPSLRFSIEKIAVDYSIDVSVVQRRTSRLAKILGLELPRAPYKERDQH